VRDQGITSKLNGRVAALAERLPAPLLLIIALVLLQLGAGLAKSIMTAPSALGMVFLRLGLGTVVLAVLVRPDWRTLGRGQWRDAVALGAVYAVFNVTTILALLHLPLGLVATIGFLGPLAVSLGAARRGPDFLWPVLGFAGVVMLTPLDGAGAASWAAISYGLADAAAWAAYILASARAGRSLAGLDGFVIAGAIATLLLAPLGLTGVGPLLTTPALIATVALVALFATAPLALEFAALKRLPPRVFGVLLSLEPGIASITGIVLLGEHLTATGWLALALVSLASVGVTLTGRKTAP